MPSKRKTTSKPDYEFDNLMNLVSGLLLHILEQVSITNKWQNREVARHLLIRKLETLRDFKLYFSSDQWDVWLDIYCDYFQKDKIRIDKMYKSVRLQSVRKVNKLLRNLDNK